MVKANWPWVGCVGGILPLWTAAVNKKETTAINTCIARERLEGTGTLGDGGASRTTAWLAFWGGGSRREKGEEEGIKGTWEGQDTDPFCTGWK